MLGLILHGKIARLALWTLATLAMLALAATLVGGCLAGPTHSGPRTIHFDGERFRNEVPVPEKGLWTVLKWWWQRDPPTWQDRLGAPVKARPPARVTAAGRVRVTFVNHATTLLQVDGVNILTDPVYSPRIGPVSWAGPRRHRSPGIRFEDLPPIDAVLISHNHYDHLDLSTLARLARRHRPQILVPLGNAPLLAEHEIPGAEQLDWWQTRRVGKLRLTFVPSRHWSGRGMGDRFRTLWGGWVIEGSGKPIYFAGDTGYGPHFAEARRRFGPMRLALLPIGAYLPRWFMKAAHMSPAEAVRAHQDLGAGTSVAIHFGTFRLSDEGQDQPPADLRRALRTAGVAESRFWVLAHGEGRDVPPRKPRR